MYSLTGSNNEKHHCRIVDPEGRIHRKKGGGWLCRKWTPRPQPRDLVNHSIKEWEVRDSTIISSLCNLTSLLWSLYKLASSESDGVRSVQIFLTLPETTTLFAKPECYQNTLAFLLVFRVSSQICKVELKEYSIDKTIWWWHLGFC